MRPRARSRPARWNELRPNHRGLRTRALLPAAARREAVARLGGPRAALRQSSLRLSENGTGGHASEKGGAMAPCGRGATTRWTWTSDAVGRDPFRAPEVEMKLY